MAIRNRLRHQTVGTYTWKQSRKGDSVKFDLLTNLFHSVADNFKDHIDVIDSFKLTTITEKTYSNFCQIRGKFAMCTREITDALHNSPSYNVQKP